MENLKKVRLMTNLAVYDKHYGDEDRKITSLYKIDYIYRKNFITRLGVLLGTTIIIGIYYGHKILVMDENIFDILTKSEFIKMSVFILAVLAVYTIIGIYIHGKRYNLAKERCEKYEKMLAKLYGEETESAGGGS